MLRSFPCIEKDEFEQACCELEKRSHDRLDGTTWLGVHWHNDELRIVQARQENSSQDASSQDENRIPEDDDEEAFPRHHLQTSVQEPLQISILLSPSYSVPVLWFCISSTRPACVDDLEEIYGQVVSPNANETLRGIGIMGGISIANHPINDVPMFFIHPCNTIEALATLTPGLQLAPYQYLMLWLGIVGSVVGLHVPLRIAADPEKS